MCGCDEIAPALTESQVHVLEHKIRSVAVGLVNNLSDYNQNGGCSPGHQIGWIIASSPCISPS